MEHDDRTIDRRLFVAAGALFLAGCATPAAVTSLPDPIWPTGPISPPRPAPAVDDEPTMSGVIARREWSKGQPVADLMNPMLPVGWITVHHDGMSPFLTSDRAQTAGRVELIRTGHRGKGWGDIGYHFVIDRAGRIWAGRGLKWQGAHVKDHNEGNIGICCLGNFDKHTPSQAQLKALQRHVATLMKTYRVPLSKVKTHREWQGAKTACPGRHLQAFVSSTRSNGRFA